MNKKNSLFHYCLYRLYFPGRDVFHISIKKNVDKFFHKEKTKIDILKTNSSIFFEKEFDEIFAHTYHRYPRENFSKLMNQLSQEKLILSSHKLKKSKSPQFVIFTKEKPFLDLFYEISRILENISKKH